MTNDQGSRNTNLDLDHYRYKFFVHEFKRSVGHSNALIETIKRLPKDIIENTTVYSFTYDGELEEELKGIKIKSFGPYPKYPFILKALYFQLICLVMLIFKRKTDLWISIGTANLWPDIVNIQFIQYQWAPMFFELSKPKGVVYLYKKILFFVLLIQEKYVFHKELFISVLAPFMKKYLLENFDVDEKKISVLPSSVDQERFSPQEIKYDEIIKKYPQLEGLDFDRPIFLFVGALERKGFHFALEALQKKDKAQFLVVGRGESFGTLEMDKSNVQIFHIPFTKEVDKIFSLADCFIFPTTYEPFGLVIFEAFAAGLEIYVTGSLVGASELIAEDPNVHLIEDINNFEVEFNSRLSLDDKRLRVEMRSEIFDRYSWDKCSSGFYELILKAIKQK